MLLSNYYYNYHCCDYISCRTISEAGDAADACALTLDTTVYLKLAGGPTIAIGDQIFNDAAGTNPYDGDGQYHRVESTDGQDWNVQIDIAGIVTAVNLCP